MAGVVEEEEDSPKDVGENSRTTTYHQELLTGRELEGGEVPLSFHQEGSKDRGEGGVNEHTDEGDGLLPALVHLVLVVVGAPSGVHHPHV